MLFATTFCARSGFTMITLQQRILFLLFKHLDEGMAFLACPSSYLGHRIRSGSGRTMHYSLKILWCCIYTGFTETHVLAHLLATFGDQRSTCP